jgi:exopolysaccharide biosynthesis polyprenyl glycosylphosphotransferase
MLDIEAYPRSIALLSWFLTIIFVSAWRITVKEFISLYLGRDYFRSHLLIIGTGVLATRTAKQAERNASIDYKIIGFVGVGGETSTNIDPSKIVGSIKDMPDLIDRLHINEVIVADEGLDKRTITKLISFLSKKHIRITSIPTAYESLIKNMILQENAFPFMGPVSMASRPASWYWGIKRILDIAITLFLIIFTFPLLAFSALAIKITSPGPIFYLQKRMGINAKRFTIAKLRTMYVESEKNGLPRWAEKNDKRITPVGKWLRLFRIDELPQLFNVLRNEMSLIGPRPERPYFYSKLIKTIPFYAERLMVKPGLTGWAQINFRYAATEKDSEEKLLYDLYYIQNMSLALDALIAFKTIKVILTGQGAQ